MTVEEKRKLIEGFCDRMYCCGECPLNDITSETETDCYSDKRDEIISRNYEIIFGKSETTSEDPVNRPAHYTDGKIEVIDYIEDKKLGFCLGNAIKYISRAGKKDPEKEVEDLNKAIWYINRRIKEVQEVQNGSVRNYQKE